jgi:hypothetical protein
VSGNLHIEMQGRGNKTTIGGMTGLRWTVGS